MGKNPRGITGLAVDTGEDVFISDALNNENFRSDVDLNPQLVQKNPESSRMSRKGVLVQGIGCLPLVDHSGEIVGCLQVFQHEHRRRESKVGSVFSRNHRQLWKTFAKCVESVMGRLRLEHSRVEASARQRMEDVHTKTHLRREQNLMRQCMSTIQRVQTEHSLDSTKDELRNSRGKADMVKSSPCGRSSLLVIGIAQRELTEAFRLPCVAVYATESGSASGESDIWTSVSSSKGSSSKDDSSSIFQLSSASNHIRRLLALTTTAGESSLVRDPKQVQEILNEMPQISSLRTFNQQNKVIVALPTHLANTTGNKSGGSGLILAVGDSSRITPSVVSSITAFGLPVLNAVVLRVAARAVADTLENTALALSRTNRECESKSELLDAIATCRMLTMKDESVDALILNAQRIAQNLFDVESADVYLFDDPKRTFWTLDSHSSGAVERREVLSNSGSVLGRFSKVDQRSEGTPQLPYITNEQAEPVCLTGDLRGQMGQRELPKNVDNPTSILLFAITIKIHDNLILLSALELINPRAPIDSNGSHTFSNEDLARGSSFAQSIGFDLFQMNTRKNESTRATHAESLVQDLRKSEKLLQSQLKKSSIEIQAAAGVLKAVSEIRTSSEKSSKPPSSERNNRRASRLGVGSEYTAGSSDAMTSDTRWISNMPTGSSEGMRGSTESESSGSLRLPSLSSVSPQIGTSICRSFCESSRGDISRCLSNRLLHF